MAGLRAKQKADRNRRILEAATSLFRDAGYDSARIEDIAERAEVSVGTLYNYYQNKGDILLAAVTMEVEEVLEAGRRIVANPPPTVAAALQALLVTPPTIVAAALVAFLGARWVASDRAAMIREASFPEPG